MLIGISEYIQELFVNRKLYNLIHKLPLKYAKLITNRQET